MRVENALTSVFVAEILLLEERLLLMEEEED